MSQTTTTAKRSSKAGTSKSNSQKLRWDPQKDSIFKDLASVCSTAGFEVRREELKQGPGWKAVSGSCRLEDKKLIFVDKKLPQDEQLAFLAQRMGMSGIAVDAEKLTALPEKIRGLIESHVAQSKLAEAPAPESASTQNGPEEQR